MAELTRALKTREKIRHWLLLLVSPLAISLFASVVVAFGSGTPIASWLLVSLGIAVALWVILYLASYTRFFHGAITSLTKLRRRRRFKKPYVIVLDGRLEENGPADTPLLFTTKRPNDWLTNLRNENPNWRIELGSVRQVQVECPDIVINPFGEAYPEEDLSLHTTFTKIRDYVSGGGVYVSVAGYPFWWKYNPVTKVRAEAGRWEQQKPNLMILKPLLHDTLLAISPVMPGAAQIVNTMQEQSERERFGEIAGVGGDTKVKMFRQYLVSEQQMIPMLRSEDGKYIIIGAVPYGAGHFILAGVEIDHTSLAFEKVAAAVCGWAKHERK
jgi:hypothetical protein